VILFHRLLRGTLRFLIEGKIRVVNPSLIGTLKCCFRHRVENSSVLLWTVGMRLTTLWVQFNTSGAMPSVGQHFLIGYSDARVVEVLHTHGFAVLGLIIMNRCFISLRGVTI